jgi:hypothetical protein
MVRGQDGCVAGKVGCRLFLPRDDLVARLPSHNNSEQENIQPGQVVI